MNKIFQFSISFLCTVAILFYLTQSVFITPTKAIADSVPVTTGQDLNFKRHFRSLGIEGSILIYDASRNLTYQHNAQRNITEFLPASTFKILNALISLETKVIPDDLTILTWDGIERKLPEWNRDLNMKEAIKLSAVWFYQVLARKVGHEQMQKWINLVAYGNQKIGNKEDIDKFWLSGKLRITPQAQIQFLRRLHHGDLPFSN